MKKLCEMENALCKASGQVERANAAVRRLEVENSTLRQEMEAAKLQAAQSAASCQEVSKREKNTLMKIQSWEKQKILFQEELVAEKQRKAQLQQKLEQSTELLDNQEVCFAMLFILNTCTMNHMEFIVVRTRGSNETNNG